MCCFSLSLSPTGPLPICLPPSPGLLKGGLKGCERKELGLPASLCLEGLDGRQEPSSCVPACVCVCVCWCGCWPSYQLWGSLSSAAPLRFPSDGSWSRLTRKWKLSWSRTRGGRLGRPRGSAPPPSQHSLPGTPKPKGGGVSPAVDLNSGHRLGAGWDRLLES